MRLLPLFPKPRNDEFCGILVWEFRLGILDWNSRLEFRLGNFSLGNSLWNSKIPSLRGVSETNDEAISFIKP